MQDLDWNALKIFGKVVETGNFSHAANAFGISQPTISRAIEGLEEKLGYQLFTRTSKGLVVSDAAKELAQYTRAMGINCETFTRVASAMGNEIKGTIRISASEIVGIYILPDLLKKIGEKYSGLDFEIIASDEIADLTEREADIAIRMASPAQNALLAQKIGEIEIGAFANPEYLKTHDTPKNIDDLAQHNMVFYDVLSPFLIPFSQEFPIISKAHFKYRAASPAVQLSLVLKGAGVGFCQAGIANYYGLKRILKDEINIKIPAYIAMHENLKNQKRYITIFRELANELRDYINGIIPQTDNAQ